MIICPSCYGIKKTKIVLHAFSEYECKECNQRQSWHSTGNNPSFCEDHGYCQYCGKYPYIECRAYPGMFLDEYGIEIDYNGKIISLFSPKEYIQEINNDGIGKLIIKILDNKDNLTTIKLPREPLGLVGKQVIQIPEGEIKWER